MSDRCVGDACRIDRLETPADPQNLHLPEVAAEAGEALRSYIPRAIIVRLDEGLDPWTREMRWVTTLFANVRTFHYGPEILIAAMQTLMAVIQSFLYEHFGSVAGLWGIFGLCVYGFGSFL